MTAWHMTLLTLSIGVIAFGPSSSASFARMPAQESLVGIYWKAVELAGAPVPALDANREPHLMFEADGRFSGADGCNRVTGAFTVKGDAVTFSQVANTQMACIDTEDVERRFQGALKGTGHWRIVDNRLQFFGATGKPLAVFERGTKPSSSASSSPLQGTTWQLVRFKGGDDTILTPDDPAKYTLEFAAGGQLIARVDCNRGKGTWKATDKGQLQLGPLALTRAKCPEGSLHDQIVRMLPFVVSYLIRDGHLFLALKLDSGIYEFAPVPPKAP